METEESPKLQSVVALRLHYQLQRAIAMRPMREILALVPGEGTTTRAAVIGVSRQAYYRWLEGSARPNERTCRRIAKLTGVPAEEIRGYEWKGRKKTR